MMMKVDFSEAMRGLEQMGEGFYARLPHTIAAIIVLLVFYFGSKFVRLLTLKVTERRTAHRNLAFIIGRLAQAGLVIVGLLISLVIAFPTFKPGQLVQLLGITSVAIGFAFRDILQNFLAGIILLFVQPFRLGDQIKFGEFEGLVEQVETRATIIRTYDGRKIVIPNANLFTNPIIVNTAFEIRRIECQFGIGYGDEIPRAKQIILNCVERIEGVLPEPPPDVLVVGFAASSVTLRVRWWIKPPRRMEALVSQDKVLEALRKELQDSGIDLPFEVRTVLFHDQTDEFDGDRSRQREGWPAGERPPRSKTIPRRSQNLTETLSKNSGHSGR